MFTGYMSLANLVVFTGNISGVHVTITSSQLIYWGIAVVVSLLAEIIVGRRLPFGIVGAFIAALAGVWLLTDVILYPLPHDMMFSDVPLLKTLLGAIVGLVCWMLVTWRIRARAPRRRQRYQKSVA